MRRAVSTETPDNNVHGPLRDLFLPKYDLPRMTEREMLTALRGHSPHALNQFLSYVQ